MLKGIPAVLSPELLKVLAEMGHGDEIVIADAHFPGTTMGKRCLRCDGLTGPQVLDAVLKLLPLDTFVEAPVTLMRPVPGTAEGEPPIWAAYRALLDKHEPGTNIQWVDRFPFYDQSKEAFATVQTGETAWYACIILKKGALKPGSNE